MKWSASAFHGDPAAPSQPVSRVHLWKPAKDGVAAGFDAEGEIIEPLSGQRCGQDFHTADLHNDGKMDLVTTQYVVFGDGTELLAANYYALMRRSDATWEVFDTNLPVMSGVVSYLST